MSKADRVEETVREMNGPLRRKYETICSCLGATLVNDAGARWKAAAEMKAVRDGQARYGEEAIPKLARALGRDDATLYKYIAVADRWSETDFDRLLRRSTLHGVPLSFSHFIELAGIEPEQRRNGLLERALAEGLGVRELARLARKGARDEPATGKTTALGASLSELVLRARRMHERLIGWSPILRRLEEAGEEPGLDELLESAIDVNKALHTEGALALRRLEATLARRKQGRSPVRVAPRGESRDVASFLPRPM
jgi:hypothetical protein